MWRTAAVVVAAMAVAAWIGRLLANVLSQMLGMGLGGTAYLLHRKDRCGDAFIIGGIGPRLVFLSDPQAVRLFFTAPLTAIEFQPAVEFFMKRVFQLPNEGGKPSERAGASSTDPNQLAMLDKCGG